MNQLYFNKFILTKQMSVIKNCNEPSSDENFTTASECKRLKKKKKIH